MEELALIKGSVRAFRTGKEIVVNKVSSLQPFCGLYTYCIVCNHFMSIAILAVCTPACANGGTCVSPGHCLCTSSWEGQYCEDGMYFFFFIHGYDTNDVVAVCSPECDNGGVCLSNGTCNCQTGWEGNHCQQG